MNFWQEAEVPNRRRMLIGAGHLAALWALAFAQPLFDLLGKTPDFFVARDNSPGDVLLLGIGFMFLPPLVMLLVEWVASRIGAKPYLAVHLALFSVLAAFIFIQILDPILPGLWVMVVLISLALGALLGIASIQVKFVTSLFDILIVAPVVVVLMFFFLSDTNKVLFPESTEALEVSVGREAPVVVLTFDELGTVNLLDAEGEIDGQRFPNFARMAETSTWYPNFSTNAYFTPMAMSGILTGNRPADGSLPTAADQPENVFSLLTDSYRLHVLEPITQICDEKFCPTPKAEQTAQRQRLRSLASDLRYVVGRLVLPERLADRLPDVGTNFEDFDGADAPKKGIKDRLFVKGKRGRNTPQEYVDFIREIPESDRAFTMMHIKQPHQPWKFGVLGEQYSAEPINQLSESTGQWLTDEPGIASAQQRMTVQSGFADTLLGEVLDRLEATGLWDRALVMVTSDHGISFEGGEVPQRKVDLKSVGEVANPPLLIKYPGESGGEVDRRHVTTLDLVPTIASELEIEGMYETEGVPLQGKVPQRDILLKDIKFNEYRATPAEMEAQREAAIERQVKRFGDGPLYTLGPSPELIGKAPGAGGRAKGAGVELVRAGAWNNYRPGQALVPMYVTGTLTGVKPGEEIVAAVNGKVRGTTRSFRFKGAVRFGTVIDPDSLKPGANQVEVYLNRGRKLSFIGGN